MVRFALACSQVRVVRLLLLFVLACSREEPRIQVDLTREHDSAGTVRGVGFVVVIEQSAGPQAPVLVMLHGRGDTARQFRESWPAFPVKLHLALPLAPLPFGGGRQWFDWQPGAGDEALADAVNAAEEKLWPAILEFVNGRQLLVGGFSQGATVAYAMAMKHPDEVTAAFVIGGRIPGKLRSERAAPIVALHGTDDDRVSIDDARAGIASLKAAGFDATLFEYPGVGHTITYPMFEQLAQSVRARLR